MKNYWSSQSQGIIYDNSPKESGNRTFYGRNILIFRFGRFTLELRRHVRRRIRSRGWRAKGRLLVHFPCNQRTLKRTNHLQIAFASLSKPYLCLCVLFQAGKSLSPPLARTGAPPDREEKELACRVDVLHRSNRTEMYSKEDERTRRAVQYARHRPCLLAPSNAGLRGIELAGVKTYEPYHIWLASISLHPLPLLTYTHRQIEGTAAPPHPCSDVPQHTEGLVAPAAYFQEAVSRCGSAWVGFVFPPPGRHHILGVDSQSAHTH